MMSNIDFSIFRKQQIWLRTAVETTRKMKMCWMIYVFLECFVINGHSNREKNRGKQTTLNLNN